MDFKGNVIYDRYYVPPYIPPELKNAVQTFSNLQTRIEKIIVLQNQYMPVKLIKTDVKGNVWKSIYFEKGFIPKWCIIKQGKRGILSDEYGRDIQDRLKWQKVTSDRLYGKLAIPKVIDLFKREDGTYIVFEYLKNTKTLIQLVVDKLGSIAWFVQPTKIKLELLNYLLQVLSLIESLHNLNYLHRDITGSNFLISAKGRVTLIDTSYSASGCPNCRFS